MRTRPSIIGVTLTLCLLVSETILSAQSNYVPSPVTVSTEIVRRDGKLFYAHTVLEKQTVWSICKAYQVSQEELYAANPGLEQSGLKSDTIIFVPVKGQTVEPEPAKTVEAPAAAPKDTITTYRIHIRKWYEDLDDIARKYDVTPEEIMSLNGLDSPKLSKRQELKIPFRYEVPSKPVDETVEQTAAEPDTLVSEPADSTAVIVPEGPVSSPKDPVEAVLFLPFQAGGNPNRMALDFYAGALLAVKDLEKEGIHTLLRVSDTRAAGWDPAREARGCDLALGPIDEAELSAALDSLKGAVPVISPLDSKTSSLLETHQNLILAPGTGTAQYEEIARWANEDNEVEGKILVVSDKYTGEPAAEAIPSAFKNLGKPYSILSYDTSEVEEVFKTYMDSMSRFDTNRIILASERKEFINDVLRNLEIVQGKRYKIVLYGPQKLRSLESEISVYHQMDLHCTANYYVDYNDPAVKAFLLEYRALYNTEPNQFAFHGYDLAKYFITLVSRHGKAWPHFISQEKGKGLHTDFLYREGSRQNEAVRRTIYSRDYSTRLLSE